MKKGIITVMLAAGALILSGCGASKGPGTPKANSETLPVLKVEQGKKYYVDNSEDLALQKKMTALMMEAVERSNVDTMKVENLDSFIEKRPISEIGYHDAEKLGKSGLVAHFKHVQDRPEGHVWSFPKYWTYLSGRHPVTTYNYRYEKHAIDIFGSSGKAYGHKYHAKPIDDRTFEIIGFESKKEATDIYLWLVRASFDMESADFFKTVIDKLDNEEWYVQNHFPRILFALDPYALEKENRLIVRTQILEASMKRPLEDLITQLGGEVVDDPSMADVLVGVKLLGYPRSLKVIQDDLERKDGKIEFSKFQSEISTVGLGGSLAHAGYGNLGGAVAGLGVAMALFGGKAPFVHYGAYAVKVIDRQSGKSFTRLVFAEGIGQGLNLMSNDSISHQILAYDAAGHLIGKSM